MSSSIKQEINKLLTDQTIPFQTSINAEELSKNWTGRGIVIPAGGLQILSNAYINIRYIKDFLGSKLPIEVWYLGKEEYFSPIIDDLKARYEDIKFINALDVISVFPFKDIHGWSLKSYCMFHSSFEEIVYLDSDCFIQIKPEKLFDYKLYTEHEALFCSDIEVENTKRIPHVNHKLGTWLPEEQNWDYTKSNPLWDILGIDEQLGTEIESGLIVINKVKHLSSLLIARLLNENRRITYKYLYGDKDTYRLAFNKTKTEYNIITQVSRSHNIISGGIDYNIIYSHRVLNSKFDINNIWDTYPNNLKMINEHVYEIIFKELQIITGNHKFENEKPVSINPIDKSIEYINYFIKHQEVKSVLDVGCGNGSLVECLDISFDLLFYHGLDISLSQIYSCKKRHVSDFYHFSNVDAINYNHYESYDLIIIRDVFHHLPFQDIYKILGKALKAQYVIIINDTPHNNQDTIRSGYRKLDIHNIYGTEIIDSFIYQDTQDIHNQKQCTTYYTKLKNSVKRNE